MNRHQRLQQQTVDSLLERLPQRSLQASSFQTQGFGVQKRAATSAPATKAELWDNYQATKQLFENGARALSIQAKLTIGQPGDKYEQEADSVAERVMAMSEPAQVQREELLEEEEELKMKPLAETISPLVQREELPEEEEELQMKPEGNAIQRAELPEEEEELQMKSVGNSIQREELPEEEELQMKQSAPSTQTTTDDLESQLSSSKGGGSPLSDDVRSFMEPRFGADFSGVRVHTGSDAVQMNRDVNAQAFAHGQDIYFGSGKSPANDALTAHELTHVVQQTGKVHTSFASRQQIVQRSPNATYPGSLSAGNNQLFFEYNSDDLTYSDEIEIANYAKKWLKIPGPYNPEIHLDAYASEEGQERYNQTLSNRRAQAVKRMLISLNVPAQKIVITAHGKTKVFSKDDLRQNRRAVLSPPVPDVQEPKPVPDNTPPVSDDKAPDSEGSCNSITPSKDWSLTSVAALSGGVGVGVTGIAFILKDLSPNGCTYHASFAGIGFSGGGKVKGKAKPFTLSVPSATTFTATAPVTVNDFNGGGRVFMADLGFGAGISVGRASLPFKTNPEWLNIGGYEYALGASIGVYVGKWTAN